MNTKCLLLLILCLAGNAEAGAQTSSKKGAEVSGQETSATEDATFTVQGRVKLPDDVSEGINTEGLSLDRVLVLLKGKYRHPRMPYPPEWREMEPEERSKWSEDFKNSEGYKDYLAKVETARSKREVHKTKVAKDGSYSCENIKPAWYELTATIMHRAAKDDRNPELARGYALHQFFVKETNKHHRVNLTLKLKNVLAVGDLAPDWTATAYDGSEFKLSDFRGKFVLMDFWATWCGPCRAEFPNLEAVFADYGGERFETIGLSVDEEMADAKKLLEEDPSTYRQGWVGEEKRHEKISEAYGFRNIPAIWLIGPDGKIVARDLRRKAIREAVKAALEAQVDNK